MGWLALPEGRSDDVTIKPEPYLPIYEELLNDRRDCAFALLELGVWKGDSLMMWRDCLPYATIVGVDLLPPDLDLGPRVAIVEGDQGDAALMARIRAEHAPRGFEVIIDDASHYGQQSARSLQALYREHLCPGGLYVIEDWGTGYIGDWPDGSDPVAPIGERHLAEPKGDPVRYASHDAGMVGLVKRLIDHVARDTLITFQGAEPSDLLAIEWMRIHNGIVILKKPG